MLQSMKCTQSRDTAAHCVATVCVSSCVRCGGQACLAQSRAYAPPVLSWAEFASHHCLLVLTRVCLHVPPRRLPCLPSPVGPRRPCHPGGSSSSTPGGHGDHAVLVHRGLVFTRAAWAVVSPHAGRATGEAGERGRDAAPHAAWWLRQQLLTQPQQQICLR